MRRLGSPEYPLDLAGQVAAALRFGCTSNGVFGAKLFAAQFEQHGSELFKRLGNPVPIFLEREDVLGQAISLTRAALTKTYFAGASREDMPRFDAALIRDYLELILRWNAGWQLYFSRSGTNPIRLTYERVMADPPATIDRIRSRMGIDEVARIDPGQLSTSIQRDAINAEWRERFLAAQPTDLQFATLRGPARITLQRRLRRVARILRLSRD